ncbi:MAG: hypothetical protein SGPRY_012282 [Prymnesium sp.]
MRKWWHRYPDQALLSYLLEGVRLEADVELQLVMVPHLTSLPMGFASVEKELRRFNGLGWYDFFPALPFMPMYCNGQGAVARKLEPDRYRRSTEGGGPRQLTIDASGLLAISINEASRIPHIPKHFLEDEREEFMVWLGARGLREAYTWAKAGMPVAWPEADERGRRTSKWPREQKPTISHLMNMLAVLNRAGALLGEPVYVFDKLQRSIDQPFGSDALFISELRLGFGTLLNVGAARALRALKAWREVTSELQLIMTILEKRTLGSWVTWLGVLIFASLGIVVIPRAKLLRARTLIVQGRNVMHGLYQPHGPGGASCHGPQGWVVCDDLMRKQLTRWLSLVLHSAGVNIKRAISRDVLEQPPAVQFILDSDARYADEPVSGIGGYCHMGSAAAGLLSTDALTTALTLPLQSQRSPTLLWAFQTLSDSVEWKRFSPLLSMQHLFGDANPIQSVEPSGRSSTGALQT